MYVLFKNIDSLSTKIGFPRIKQNNKVKKKPLCGEIEQTDNCTSK